MFQSSVAPRLLFSYHISASLTSSPSPTASPPSSSPLQIWYLKLSSTSTDYSSLVLSCSPQFKLKVISLHLLIGFPSRLNFSTYSYSSSPKPAPEHPKTLSLPFLILNDYLVPKIIYSTHTNSVLHIIYVYNLD